MIEGADHTPITLWLRSLEAGDGEAAEKLWRHFFDDVVRLARARLRGHQSRRR